MILLFLVGCGLLMLWFLMKILEPKPQIELVNELLQLGKVTPLDNKELERLCHVIETFRLKHPLEYSLAMKEAIEKEQKI